MANLPILPALGDYITPTIITVEEIPDNAIPTDLQIVRETRRREKVKIASQTFDQFDPTDAAEAEVRYHTVLSRRSNALAPVHPQILQMFQAVQNGQIQLQQQVQNFPNQIQVEIQNHIQDLQANIAQLQNLPGEIQILQNQIQPHLNGQNQIQQDIGHIQNDIAQIQHDIAPIQEIANIQQDIANIQQDIDPIHHIPQIQLAIAPIAQIQENIVTIQENLAQIQQNIAQTNLRLESSLRALTARTVNRSIEFTRPVALFQLLPKLIPGHPFQNPPAVQGVIIHQNYQVGDAPPNNLIPRHYREMEGFMADALVHRDRLRAIFWFYNDPRLSITPAANGLKCLQGWKILESYLKE